MATRTARPPLSRILPVVLAILVSACLYIGMRTVTHVAYWLAIVIPAALIWSLPTFVWSSRFRGSPRNLELLQLSAFIAMVFLSWLFALTVLRDVALGAGWIFGYRELGLSLPGDLVFASSFFFSAIGYWLAMRGPRIRRIEVPIVGLPPALLGFRIAQITDLHVGPTIGRRYVENVVALVASIKPDLTVLTGDIVDGSAATLRDSVAPLAQLLPPGRVFYAPGNHEYYHHIEEWLPVFTQLGANPLLNRGESFTHQGKMIWVGGVTDPAAVIAQGELPNPAKAALGGEKADLRVLLSHRPEMAKAAEAAGFQLQLSGHTHGGQFFPWTLVAKFFHEYFLGLMRHGKMWIYVSPGTGTWGPPARVGTIPEVTLLILGRAA